MTDRRCFQNHMGVWACEPKFFASAVGAVKAGQWRMRAMEDGRMSEGEDKPLYEVTQDGVGIVIVSGVMMKGESKFADTVSTVRTRQALKAALGDPAVASILMVFDSPGGYSAGTAELADDIAAADTVKHVESFAEDLMASAAYWAGSRARKITANRAAEIGSIGVYAVVEDWSKAYEMAGIQVHVVSTGGMKGAFADGAPVTDDQLAYLQSRVDDVNKLFLESVKAGRGDKIASMKDVTDGRVFGSADAKKMGLIDAVDTLDNVLARMGRAARGNKAAGRVRQARALAELEDRK